MSGEPDIVSVPLSGNEDFLILGCDGLWDHVTEDDVAFFVYKQVRENPGKFLLIFINYPTIKYLIVDFVSYFKINKDIVN